MKKISSCFLVIAYFFSFYVAYLQTDYEEFEKIKNIEKSLGQEFVIPSLPGLATPEEIYPILYESAKGSKVNILRAGINYKENDEVELMKFILLTTKTHFFNHFNLNQGRFLTIKDTKQDTSYLSTSYSDDVHQIGEFKDFGGNHLITIRPLKSSYSYFSIHGTYYVEGFDNKAFNKFINTFTNQVNTYLKKYNISYTAEDFIRKPGEAEINGESFTWISILTYLSYVINAIAILLLVYYIFNESKRISILKMYGVSNIRLWYIVVGKLITIIFVFSVGTSAILAALIKNATYLFVLTSAFYELRTYVVLITLSLFSYVYISRIKIINMMKNFKDTKGIFILNMFIKIGCSILLILIGLSTWSDYTSINDKKNDLKNWEHSKDYGVLYPVNSGYDGDMIFGRDSLFESTSHEELYFLLNKMGGILINSLSYEESDLILNRNWKGIRSIKVNSNYLREFPVIDIHNKPVHVSEDMSNWLLLVPEKYSTKEKEILSFFQGARKSNMINDQEFYKKVIPGSIKKQKIEIKWLKDNQSIFSFNPEVFPSENNMIIDPVIEVVTEKNSLMTDRDAVLGQGPGDPMKIKLINRDLILTYKLLEPQLKKLKLDDNLKHLITIDQYILQQIYQKQNLIRENLLVISGLGMGLMLLVVQNLIIFFNNNQQKFIVRRLFGMGFFRTYKEYVLLFSAIWFIQAILSCIANREAEAKLFVIMVMLLIVEIIASIIALAIIEKKSKVKVLKGGD
ncbi:DUF1430 domain-containing protein [Paenibacillus kribbensis]|uniref:DUF1430 domain-containing protein n=1 Tax=Paenibacillus kribbensis TaxID=172713 RepID=UPI0015C1B294|nr:DUF1430 domain-containing protein [Paenibacillus kribbensis]